MQPAEALRRLCSDEPHVEPPRTLLVVAHPDDDVVGAASRLPRLSRTARVVFVTDGAPDAPRFYQEAGFATREAYAAARRNEARRALALAGFTADRLDELSVTDQGAARHLAQVARRLAALIDQHRPQALLTHAYEGGHPDHDAVAFAAHAAAASSSTRPVVLEFASYNARQGALCTYEFLAHAGHEPKIIELSAAQRELKQRMFACHASQQPVLAQFDGGIEAFRIAPRYDFTKPPAESLYYEHFDWGMRSEQFCALARHALVELGLNTPL